MQLDDLAHDRDVVALPSERAPATLAPTPREPPFSEALTVRSVVDLPIVALHPRPLPSVREQVFALHTALPRGVLLFAERACIPVRHDDHAVLASEDLRGVPNAVAHAMSPSD